MARMATGRPRRTFVSQTRKRVWARETHSASFTNITVKDLCEDFCTRYGTNSLPPGVTVGGLRFSIRVDGDYPRSINSALVIGIIVDAVGSPGDNSRISRPVENPHADWMYYEALWVPNRTNATGSFSIDTNNFGREVKSKRKLEEVGQSLFFVTESLVVGEAYSYALQCSTLLILP